MEKVVYALKEWLHSRGLPTNVEIRIVMPDAISQYRAVNAISAHYGPMMIADASDKSGGDLSIEDIDISFYRRDMTIAVLK